MFQQKFSIGDEYYKDGLYDEAERYYRLAKECSDRDPSVDIDNKLKDVAYCSTLRKRINDLMLRADILEKQPADLDSEIDSVYWYRSNIIDGLKLLQRKNPADDFCSATSIASLENDLKNSSRYIGGIVTDLEYTNQVLANVIIYGSENENANPKSMVRLGESGADGKFKVQVPNKYTILYFEHGKDKDYNKPVRVNITNGKLYKYHVKLQRRVMRVGF
ncbi:MAG: hypothetical protein LUD15_03285 [Bacteroides sp.]|nr:hypothetical protein [Bacteroides sp.]